MQAKLSELALALIAPGNRILYDDKGLPSVMVEIPQMKMSDLISGGDNSVHPAFIVNGEEKESIFISKYQNCVHEERAYSLPAMVPEHSLTFDTARQYCANKGPGWHLMTAAEYSLIALICHKAGFFPLGNNQYGKDYSESSPSGVAASTEEGTGRTMHIYTGTGSLSYSHNNARDGIFDVNGNVSEWTAGKRMVCGEIQLIPDNDAADNSTPQTASAVSWKAIDATTGEFVTPDGSGTTANTIKINAANETPQWNTEVLVQAEDFYTQFKDLTCASSISSAAKNILFKYLLLPTDSNWGKERHFFDNISTERLFASGGNFVQTTGSGVACSSGAMGDRTFTAPRFGFRSAYVSL